MNKELKTMNTPKTVDVGKIAPPPWTWDKDKPLLAADGQLVNGVSRTKEQLAAHRALIALAPELAEALRGCSDALTEAGKDFAINSPMAARPNLYELHAEKAQALLAKLPK